MIDEYHNRIWRLMPRRNDAVNDTWMCDAGRLNYGFVASAARLRQPLVAHNGTVSPVAWAEALDCRAGAAWHARRTAALR